MGYLVDVSKNILWGVIISQVIFVDCCNLFYFVICAGRYSAKSRLLTNMEQGWVLLELEENIGSHDGYRNEAVGYNTDDVRRKTFRECMIHDHIL